jgi:replicative DNA helicase
MTIQDVKINKSFIDVGKSFQKNLLKILCTDITYLKQIYGIISPEFFSTSAYKTIAELILEYFDAYKQLPTKTFFEIYVDKLEDKVLKSVVGDFIAHDLFNEKFAVRDAEFIKEKTLEFCKQQALKNAIVKSVEYLEEGQYSSIKSTIEKALHAGEEHDIGINLLSDLDDILSPEARRPIVTGHPALDELMHGGLSSGELGVVVGPTGSGKSHILVNLGAAAVEAGKTVVHYSFELSDYYVGLRYVANLINMDINKLYAKKDYALKAIRKIQESTNLTIKEFPMKRAGINAISAHLDKLRMTKEIVPDIIIIDYADVMLADNVKFADKRFEQGSIYEDLKGFAKEMQRPVWTASQSNRSSAAADITTAEHISESYEKAMVADFIITINRSMYDKMNNTARFYVPKNRMGIDGILYSAAFDTTKSQFELFELTPEEKDNYDQTQSETAKQLVRKLAGKISK